MFLPPKIWGAIPKFMLYQKIIRLIVNWFILKCLSVVKDRKGFAVGFFPQNLTLKMILYLTIGK